MKSICIAGGGVAGLSLGIALAKKGVPTHLHDGGFYPRHRVCGEFICGIKEETIGILGIEELFQTATPLKTTEWFINNKSSWRYELPYPAWGISRYKMDDILQQKYQSLGGKLYSRSKLSIEENQEKEGVVWANGRAVEPSKWIGLKAHFKKFPISKDLEMHMGKQAYVGISHIEDGKVNVCGLFTKNPQVRGRSHQLLLAYIRASGLNDLADKLENSEQDDQSCIGVSSVNFSTNSPPSHQLKIGDQYSVIPPFTGNGMSLAMESAATILPFVLNYAEGKQSWSESLHDAKEQLAKNFNSRLQFAGKLHPLLTLQSTQKLISTLLRQSWFPSDWLFHKLH